MLLNSIGDLLIGQKCVLFIETLCICHDWAVLSRDICFIKAVYLLCEHGYFHLILRPMVQKAPPPSPILLGLSKMFRSEVLSIIIYSIPYHM